MPRPRQRPQPTPREEPPRRSSDLSEGLARSFSTLPVVNGILEASGYLSFLSRHVFKVEHVLRYSVSTWIIVQCQRSIGAPAKLIEAIAISRREAAGRLQNIGATIH